MNLNSTSIGKGLKMRLKQIDIGGLKTKNNVFLAPLAGYSNGVFRELCYDLGAGLTFTEMVSAKGLCYNSEKTKELLYITPNYVGIKACQIFGGDPEYMRRACESEELAPFELIDINMGCPVPKIYKNGEGSYLLSDILLAEKIISECKKSGKRISVKFRTGIDSGHIVGGQFAKMCENAGADMICIHGRTRDKMYAGEVDFKEIEKAKGAVKIPVIANGGVFSLSDAENLLDKTGADGVAIARGAMYNPRIFSEITGTDAGNFKQKVLKQIADTKEVYGERFACVFMRKMVSFYIKGQKNSVALRTELLKVKDTEELTALTSQINFDG